MEVWITEFRNNASAYFDKAFFEEEEIILTRRNHRVKITKIEDDVKNWEVFTDEDDKNFDDAIRSDFIRNKLKLLAKAL